MRDIWSDTSDRPDGRSIAGYRVEALDGEVGKVDDHTDMAGETALLVDTGFWIFGKTRVLPMDVVSSIDHEDECVTVGLSKHAVHNAPDWGRYRREADNSHWDRHDRDHGPIGPPDVVTRCLKRTIRGHCALRPGSRHRCSAPRQVKADPGRKRPGSPLPDSRSAPIGRRADHSRRLGGRHMRNARLAAEPGVSSMNGFRTVPDRCGPCCSLRRSLNCWKRSTSRRCRPLRSCGVPGT